ncbi:major facilitator superfamily domain-containing protein [Aspergillus pseudoustus]|uniref:Major facilitator superfamily domain-containing protein n=1 Tax=Aspergillus pseudoustus TaxID=1810923 RepID=A0ABR4JHH4_9EURO
MILIGSFLGVFGMMMLSLAKQYFAIFLSQGVCMGLGFGLLYVPIIALVSRSFTTRRAVALGVSTSGAPAGGIIYTCMFNQLITKLGFPWTVRCIGFVMLALFSAAAVLLFLLEGKNKNPDSAPRRTVLDIQALKDKSFWSFTVANFFLDLGYLTPFYYIPTYAETKLGTSTTMASNILMISQACSMVGRVILTIFAHYYGSIFFLIFSATLSGILCITWISASSLAKFILFASFYGGISGALIPLPPSVFSYVCPDPKRLGTWLGMSQSLSSFATLLGPPIAGALASIGSHSSADLNYLGIQLFSGIAMCFGAFQIIGLWPRSAQVWVIF